MIYAQTTLMRMQKQMSNFYKKNKLKSEMLKCLTTKKVDNFFSVITNNSNQEILTKNVVTFKS